jgi:hypothetical protein
VPQSAPSLFRVHEVPRSNGPVCSQVRRPPALPQPGVRRCDKKHLWKVQAEADQKLKN